MAYTKEQRSEHNKKYYDSNKEKKAEHNRKYYKENKDRMRDSNKKWREGNKDKISHWNKEYRDNNKDIVAAYAREYYTEYEKERKQKDPGFKILKRVKARHRDVLKGRVSTTKGLGCTSIQLQAHIESLFTDGMYLSNHGRGAGKWHLDHIIPMASYQRDTSGGWDIHSEYNKKLIHYTNLRPMWEEDNLEKSDNIDENELKVFTARVI